MKLYFAPMAASMAARITLYELGLDATYVEVDRITKRMKDGTDYHEVHPLGLVPALELDDGELLTESAVVLRHLGQMQLDGDLAPQGRELDAWLSFLVSELHTPVFRPLFRLDTPEAARAFAVRTSARPLAYLNEHLREREHLLSRFTVADALLSVMLSWTVATPVSLDDYPALASYHARVAKRPSVVRARAVELPLFRAAAS